MSSVQADNAIVPDFYSAAAAADYSSFIVLNLVLIEEINMRRMEPASLRKDSATSAKSGQEVASTTSQYSHSWHSLSAIRSLWTKSSGLSA